MSEVAVVPSVEAGHVEPKRVSVARMGVALALVSFSGLLLELSLTRLFSVILFYHFAFLAISIALLGLGAGGVFAYLGRKWLARWSTPRLAAALCLINSVVVVLALEIVLHQSVNLGLSWRNLAHLTILYCAAALPFFFIGLVCACVFARETDRISVLYGADLMGGAAACLAVVPLLNLIGAPNALLFAGAALAAACVLWSTVEQAAPTPLVRRLGFLATGVLLIVIAANYSGRLMDVVFTKGARRDPKSILFSRWNAISRVDVTQDPNGARWIVIDADANTALMSVDPHAWHGTVWQRNLMAAAPAIANVLRPRGNFAIIGPGGGVDVVRAVANGSRNVTAIEINPIIANTIMRYRFADYAYHLYDIPEVHMHVSDGRSWLRASRDHYDVVQMTLVDTWASTAAGAFALSENNLYTREAFREYFEHLKPGGFLAITRWEFAQPREALRVVAEAMDALARIGVQDTRSHFLIISDGTLDEDGRPVTVLASRDPFPPADEAALLHHLQENPKLVLQYAPSAPQTNAFSHLIASNDPVAFARQYRYNVTPVDDNAPFFFFTLKTREALRHALLDNGRGMDWKSNVGVVVLGMVLVISVLAVLLFLIGPLAVHDPARRSGHSAGLWVALLYFVGIGLGYILVEIALIQRFVLFLGHPTYALTVVVFLMLLASGAGSMAARRWMQSRSQLFGVIGTVVAGIVGYLWLLPFVLASLVGVPFMLKLAISTLLIAPLAFTMGMPFPAGLRALAARAEVEQCDSAIEWAWAMNAAASVLGSVLAMVVAIHFGLNVTLANGAAAYVVAVAVAAAALPQLRSS
jgi:hypothetical protein